ncbi:MAG: alpha-amylase family glycosyl hydrolase [bacterium]|nr:alpha-amylase family glycosyl hydrolase [bacterium]
MKSVYGLLAFITVCQLGVFGRDTQGWFNDAVIAEAKEATSFDALAKRGVTAVVFKDGKEGTPDAAAFVRAAHAAGLKALIPIGFAPEVKDRYAHTVTNLLPRIVASEADGWVAKGSMSGQLEHWEFVRDGIEKLRPSAVFVSDGSRLGNQVKAFDADYAPPWFGTLDPVLKGKKPVSELVGLWSFMRKNRPEGARFLRSCPHWSAAPIAFAMCLDGVPLFTPGQALASCSSAVLPKLAALRTESTAFRTGELIWLDNNQPEKVASFVRTGTDGRSFVCVFNLRREAVTAKVSLPFEMSQEAILSEACTFASGTYAFSGLGYDIRERPVVERAGPLQRALEAAKTAKPLEKRKVDYSRSREWKTQPAPDYLKGAVMYQLFLRMFTPEGTLKAAEARLPFVKSLGTDIIYLCPVAKADRGTDPTFWSARQKQSRFGNPCNPYRIEDYFAVDSEYGTEQDLKDFVAAAHQLGMKVYFDLVYYHCGPNAVFLKNHPDWVLRKSDGSFELGEWAFPRLDIQNTAVREYLYENMRWYLTEFDCDGFRCDVGDMVPLGFREEAHRRNRQVKPDVVMMCEGDSTVDQVEAFELNYAFPMQRAIGDFLRGRGSATNLSVACVAREAKAPKGYRWMRCFQNHDYANCAPGEDRWEKKYGLDLNDGLLATIYTLDGVPMLYNGQEVADTAPHSIWSNRFHGKWCIDWSAAMTPAGEHRRMFIQSLAKIRHEHPSFFDAPTIWVETPYPDDVYAFQRPLADGTTWTTAVNISAQNREFRIPAGSAARLAGPGATLDMASGRLVLPARSWLIAANGPCPLIRLPHVGKTLEAWFHPTYASAHAPQTTSARAVPDFLRTSVMYQLFTRMFTPEGTFNAARAKLPELKDLGIDIIYLTPHQLSDDDANPKYWSGRQKACKLGNPKNPYRQKDYFAVDPEYGTKEDLQAFVSEAHRLGMKVMFDLVYFHCGPTAVFLKEHPEYIVRNPDGTPKLGEWAFPEMDIAKPAVREYLYANMLSFIRDYDVDGFRCDVADMLPVDFWEEGARRCRAIKPGFFLMCEGLKGDDQISAFDLSYGFYTQWTLVDLLAGKATADLLEKAWRAQRRDYPQNFHWMRCFENHDFANVNPGQKRKEELYGPARNAAMLATCFLLDGVPMLYNGQEIADAAPHSIYANRDHGRWCIDWSRASDEAARERRALIKRLTDLRHRNPALFDAPVIWHTMADSAKVFAFSRTLPGENTLRLAVNMSKEEVTVSLSGGDSFTLSPNGFEIREE